MNNVIEREQVSSYRVAAQFHYWGLIPRVRGADRVDFLYENFNFSCVIEEQTILFHFGDVIFKEYGSTVLYDIQVELGSINKRIDSSFCCLSAFNLKAEKQVGIEITYHMPIISFLALEHLSFVLDNFLRGSIQTLNILAKLGYRTKVNYLLNDKAKEFTRAKEPVPVETITPQKIDNAPKKDSIPKKERCFSCDGDGQYRGGTVCSICDGHGVSREVMAKKKRDNMPANESLPEAKRCHVCKGNGKLWDGSVCFYCLGNGIDRPFNIESGRKTEDDSSHYDCDGDSIGWSEGNSMQDDDISDYSAEMGHDGDDE